MVDYYAWENALAGHEYSGDDTRAVLSEAALQAVDSGADVVYGESHSTIAETMGQIGHLIQNAPQGSISAIVVEFPPEMQVLLEPDTLKGLTSEHFILAALGMEVDNMAASAQALLDEGRITAEQFEVVEGFIDDARLSFGMAIADEDAITNNLYYPLYEMAVQAADQGIPVIAADVDRKRHVMEYLGAAAPYHLMPTPEEVAAVTAAEMDDSSDLAYLESQGIDIEAAGALVVHRGYNHINNFYSAGIYPLEEPVHTQGFDDLLEGAGRQVLTIGILAGVVPNAAPDPADIIAWLEPGGALVLDGAAGEVSQTPDAVDHDSDAPTFDALKP